MKIAIRSAWITLGCSVLAFVIAAGWAALGRSLGEEWSSLDGPEPVWPAVIGFSAPYVFVLALSALAILGCTRLLVERRRRRRRSGASVR